MKFQKLVSRVRYENPTRAMNEVNPALLVHSGVHLRQTSIADLC